MADPTTPANLDTTPTPATSTIPTVQETAAQPANVDTTPTPATSPAGTEAPQQAAPTVLIPQKKGGLAGVLDSVRDAIAGGNTSTQTYIDPNSGERYIQHPAKTGKQEWMNIGREALTGAAAGLAAGKGAGNQGRALAAGLGAEQSQEDQLRQRQEQAAEGDYARQRQAKIDNANSQIQQAKLVASQFALTRMKTQAMQEDEEFSDKQIDRQKQLQSAYLGHVDNLQDLVDLKKQYPSLLTDHFKDNTIRTIPVYGADGKPAGLEVYQEQPGIAEQLAPADTKIPIFHPPDNPGERPRTEWISPSIHLTNGAVANYEATYQNQMNEWTKNNLDTENKQTEINLHKQQAKTQASEQFRNYQEGAKAAKETEVLNNATDQATISSNAQQLVEGSADPSNLSKRSKSYDATLAAATAYSLQKYGRPFDVAKAIGDYKFATSSDTYKTLNYLNSLVGPDNKGGNLQELVNQSDALPRTQFPPINDVAQWAKLEAGNKQIAAYYATITEVSDQVAKILQGGTGGTSDAKLRQAQDLFQKGFTSDQIKGVANDSLRPLLANRKSGIIGDNRYLQQWHGQVPTQQTTPAAAPAAGAPAAPGAPAAAAPAAAPQSGTGFNWNSHPVAQ